MPARPAMVPPVGEIGAAHDLAELVDRDGRVVDDGGGGIDDLAEVVRRDVGRHADGDAGRAVHQQIGQRAREDRGLGRGLLVVGREIDGLLVDVLEEIFGDLVEAALRVTIGGRGVTVDGAEVALRVDERVTQHPILAEAHERVVHGQVAVRVIVLEHFADDAGAFIEGAIVQQALARHGVKDAALHGLEAVAGVRQRAGDDDRHRVVDVGRLHDVGDIGRVNFLVRSVHCGKTEGGSVGGTVARLCVEELDVERVIFDELAARRHLVAHEQGEERVGLRGIGDVDAQEPALFRIHGGLEELLGVHFTETLVSLNGEAFAAEATDV